MTIDKSKFIDLNKNKSGTVIFGNNNGENIIGKEQLILGLKMARQKTFFS